MHTAFDGAGSTIEVIATLGALFAVVTAVAAGIAFGVRAAGIGATLALAWTAATLLTLLALSTHPLALGVAAGGLAAGIAAGMVTHLIVAIRHPKHR